MKYISNALASALLATLLIGCGSSEPVATPKTVSIAGVASDDLIVNGIVKAYGANDASKTLLDSGRTSRIDGSYILDVIYNGVVVVEVTCDGASQMLTPSGAKIDCAPNLELHSAAAVTPTSGSTKVNISPLTEAVVQRMETLGNADIKPEHLETASDNIEDMFGVNPIEDNPLEGDYSGIIASFHDLAEATAGKTITDVINEVAEDLKDGEAGDSNLTKGLAQEMQDQNLTNGIADNNGTFDPVVNALAFTSDELVGHTFFLVENGDFGKFDINATHTKWTSMFDETDYDTDIYTIEDNKFRFSDGSMVERIVKTEDYSVLRIIDDGESVNVYMFNDEAKAKAKIAQLSANFSQVVQDLQTDSKKSHAGFELTSLTTTIVDNALVVVVKSKGDIQDALDTVANTPDYANILWININNYYEFGLMSNGEHYMQRNIRTDGAFEGEINGTVAGYSHHLLPDNKGVVLHVPLSSLERIEDITTGALIVSAEVGEDDTTINAEGEDGDENSYDKIETFVSLKTVLATSAMFANKTFYSQWMEDTGVVYNKIQTTTTDVNATEQSGNQVTVSNGTYTIENGKVSLVMDDGNFLLSVLDIKADHLVVMYEDDEGVGIEWWSFAKPAGFPSFVEGVNSAPEIAMGFSPVTMIGFPLPMDMVDFSDSDGDALTFGVVSVPQHGILQINNQIAVTGETIDMASIQGVVYIPADDFNGTVTSEINASDGVDTATQVVTITALDENNTAAISTTELNGKTFYIADEDENGAMQFLRADFNATDIRVDGVAVLPYTVTDDKVVSITDETPADSQDTYVLAKTDRFWTVAATYGSGDKVIEYWFLQSPVAP